MPGYAKALGLDLLAPVNSNGDPAQQITDVNTLLNLGARGIVVGQLDSAAIGRALDAAAARKVPVVAVDVAPTQGKVAMVMRADNHAYGEKACRYIGEHVPRGKVAQIAHSAVATVLTGAASAQEVRENVEAFATPIPPAFWDALRDAGLLDPAAPTPRA